jgi:hypothetical protein
MRSVKYHSAYWAIAYTAATAYHALTLELGVPVVVFHALLFSLLVLFFNIIVQGPRPEPWPYHYYVSFGVLLVSLGPLSSLFSIPGVAMSGPN